VDRSKRRDKLVGMDSYEFKSFLLPSTKLKVIYNLFTKVIFPKKEEFIKLSRIVIKEQGQRLSLFDYLKRSDHFLKFIPLHNSQEKPTKMSNQNIRKYFGDNISIYYFFLSNYCYWLIFPAILGVISWYFQALDENFSVNESPYEALYGFFVIIWANLFFIFWERKENSLKVEFQEMSKITKAT